jgi:soluble lytic murein transglycosylase
VISLTRAVWTEHRNTDAQKIITNFSTSKAGSNTQKANAFWLSGSLYLEAKEHIKALAQYEKAESIKANDQNLRENIQWAIVWNNYLLKRYDSVINFTDKFMKKSSNNIFVNKLNFWKARSLVKLHKTDDANLIFTEIAHNDPFGYYGIISTIDTNLPLTRLAKSEVNHEATGKIILDWLLAMEEKEYSQKYLKEIDSQFKTPKDREKAMLLYAQTEWYQGGMRQIYNFSPSSRNMLTEKYISSVYPTPYAKLTTELANRFAIPAELIYAIARQESAFVPTERSWADAFGLMQLIPEVAHELSRKSSIPYNNVSDLYVPEINLALGSALLKNLEQKFQGKFAQTVAGYNASQDVIKVWERERFNGNYIEFIEMIPYEETRNYIKLVFRNFITYKRINSTKEFFLDKDFFAKPF